MMHKPSRFMIRVLVVVLAVWAVRQAQAAVRYVNPAATGANNGSSWTDGHTTLAAAITAGATDEIWVKAGTYTHATAAGLAVSTHTLYGGFNGTEGSRDDRDWEANPTILDGQGARRAFTKTVTGRFTLDGFTVKNSVGTTGGGGGVYVSEVSGSALTIGNCIFRLDTAGTSGNEIYRSYGNMDIAYTIIDQSGVFGTPTYGSGMLSGDPHFASETPPYDLHLKSKGGRWDPATELWVNDAVHSPGVDSGDPASAYVNEPHDNGGRINMVRYGNTSEASKRATRTLFLFR